MSLPSDFFGRIVFILQHYGPSFLNGAGKTMAIAIVGTFIGCIIGFAVGIIQTIPVIKSDNPIKRFLLKLVKFILNVYVEVFRGTPMMVQAMFIFYGSSVLTHFQTMVNVIMPQALRNIMPQIGNNLIINIKDTCVLSVIGVVELFYATKGVAGAYYTYFEAFGITMIIYFILTFTCSRILRYWEKKMDGPDSYDLATTDTLAYTSGMVKFPDPKEKEDK